METLKNTNWEVMKSEVCAKLYALEQLVRSAPLNHATNELAGTTIFPLIGRIVEFCCLIELNEGVVHMFDNIESYQRYEHSPRRLPNERNPTRN